MNELSLIFDRMDINTYEVLEAAGTKWNFLKFFPGLGGGYCIGVDPYYLTYKANALCYHSKIITRGRVINDSMGSYVAETTIKKLIKKSHKVNGAKILIMGATFKENVSDIRNSKVADVYNELVSYSADVDVVDPYADSEELLEEYGFKLLPEITEKYEAIILSVNHEEYLQLDEDYFKSITKENAIFVDIKGVFRGQIKDLTYWSL